MNTEILLSRGETVTTFELPAAGAVKIFWPEPKLLKIGVPVGSKYDSLKSAFSESYKDILNSELFSHLEAAWPTGPDLETGKKAVSLDPWGNVQIEIVPQKSPRVQPDIGIDRPRITIQMGKRVDEFSDHCKNHLKPELFEHVIRLWSDPDHCRTVLPVGRNLLIRGCA
jgi:hypothetical protein